MGRARDFAGRVFQRLAFLWGKPAVRTGLVLVALAAILFNAVFFHIAAMPEGILQPATDETYVVDPAYQVSINGELPPQLYSYIYGPVLGLMLGYTSVVISLLRVAVSGLPIKTLAEVGRTEFVFYGRLWNAGILALASLLVYWMIARATGRRAIGLCAALIFSFGSHIMRLAKPDMTSDLFSLAAVAAAAGYLASRRFRPARLSLAIAVVLMVLAFFTKYTAAEFVVILPFAVVVKALRERGEHPDWIKAIARDLLIVGAISLGTTLLIGQISFFKNQDHFRAFTNSLVIQAGNAHMFALEGRTAWINWLRLDYWRQRLNVYSAATTGSIAFTFLCVAATVRYLFSPRAALNILAAGTFFALLRALGRSARASFVDLIAVGLVILGAVFVFELGGWLTLLVARLWQRRAGSTDARKPLVLWAGALFSSIVVGLICVSAVRTQDRPVYAYGRAISQVLEQCPGLRPQQVWFGQYDDRDFSPAWQDGVNFYTTYGADSTEKMLSQAAPLLDSVLVLRPLDPDPRVELLTLASSRIWQVGSYMVLETGSVNCVPSVSAQDVAELSAGGLGRIFRRLYEFSFAYKQALYGLLPAGLRPDYWPRTVVVDPAAYAGGRHNALVNSLKAAVASPEQYANTLSVLRDYYAAHSSDDTPQVALIRDSVMAAEVAVASQDNYIGNASFDEVTSDESGRQFAGWQTADFWNTAAAPGSIRSTGGHNTATALEIEMNGPAKPPERIGLQQDCGVLAPGTSLVLQADLNLPKDLLNARARVDVVLYGDGSPDRYSVLSVSHITATGGWHTATSAGKAPAAAGQYRCMIVVQVIAEGPVPSGSNLAQFDNIVLRPAAAAP